MSESKMIENEPVVEGSAGEVFVAFGRLGLTAFGGPIAHLEHFRRELIEKRRWLRPKQYGELLAICQFLPGPASSQLGFALGLLRAGWLGGLAAFIAFTLPSAVLLAAFALALPSIDPQWMQPLIAGLKLVALVVVAHGVLGLGKALCPDTQRQLLAAMVTAALLVAGSATWQLLAIAVAAVWGMVLNPAEEATSEPALSPAVGRKTGFVALALFALGLLVALTIGRETASFMVIAATMYEAGALVFGGGHVVLPLLETHVVGNAWLDQQDFLAGYGAAQVIPGPMFTFATFLGASITGSAIGAGLATLMVFLPGLLLVVGILPIWRLINRSSHLRRAVAGVNAGVVGLLAAALYDPIFTSAVATPIDLAIAVLGFGMMLALRCSVLWIVAWCVLASFGRVLVAG